MADPTTKSEAALQMDALEKKAERHDRAAARALANGGRNWADRELDNQRRAAECRAEVARLRLLIPTLPA